MSEAQKLFAGPCDFIAGVANLSQLPGLSEEKLTLPEVGFVGRSNVGKSSLLNALTNRNALARTSHTPGRTQQLNFFNLGDRIMLVDMPGYGYAKVSKADKKAWDTLIKNYLRGRPNLRCAFVLVDSRHGIKDNDTEMMKMLDEAAVPYRIILTKIDKLKDEAREKIAAKITAALKKHPAAFPEPLLASAHKKWGLEEVQDYILSMTV